MKYCTKCGTQIMDEAVICPNCGCATGTNPFEPHPQAQSSESILKTIAKIFMIIGCIASAPLFLIPLCWKIPMTIHYWNAVRDKRPVSTAFKVCSLLFASLIAGILMLCDSES